VTLPTGADGRAGMIPSVSRARRAAPWLALAALVLASAGARAAAARSFTVPWIAPDEILYALVGEDFWQNGTLTVRGLPTPYYSLLYPAVVGLPLQLSVLDDAIRVAQALQALLMSAAAVPLYLCGRRLLPTWLALAAAALTLLVPALAYSGLLMTEALFYPLAIVALAALARALEKPSAWNQGVFLFCVTLATAVRMQALVLLPTFVAAALLHAAMSRSTATLRRLRPFLGIGLAVTFAGLAYLLVGGAGWEDVLGAYGTLGGETTLSANAAQQFVWHLAGVALITLGLPLVATTILVGRALGTGERDPAAASFLATAAAYTVLLVVQVGLFAAARVPHVSERYLVTAGPPLLLGLCLWVARGLPRPRWLTAGAGLLLIGLAVAVPIDRIAPETGFHDDLSSAALLRLTEAASEGWAKAALVAGAVIVVALVYLARPRIAVAVVGVVAVGLAVQSVVATAEMETRSKLEQRSAVGSTRWSWIDEAGEREVTLLGTADRPWASDARTFYWNRSVTDVVAIDDVERPVPPTVVRATADPESGVVLDARGNPISRRVVAAPATMLLAGSRLAREPVIDSQSVPLVLWGVSGPLRVAERHIGFQPNGDFTELARVIVSGCSRGNLELTLIGKSGVPIDAFVNGTHVKTIAPQSGETLHAEIPAPRYADGTGPCFYELRTSNLVGTTRVEFVAAA
jgi:dolichyl-phosphate-mannose-protein mannosyltransferase